MSGATFMAKSINFREGKSCENCTYASASGLYCENIDAYEPDIKTEEMTQVVDHNSVCDLWEG